MDEDFFEFLYRHYVNTLTGRPRSVEDFVPFCRDYLKDNPPIGTAVVGTGLAVRLRKGEVLSFQRPAAAPQPGKAISISKAEFDPERSGISNTDCMNITDPDQPPGATPGWGPSR